MEDSDILILMVVALVVYFVVMRQDEGTAASVPASASPSGPAIASLQLGGPPPAGQTNTGSHPNTLQTLESAAQSYTHVPLATVGHLAQASPTWLKVAVFPIGVTAIAQDLINNPKGAAKAVGGFVSSAGKGTARVTVTAVKDAGKVVGHVGGALESGAKGAAHAVSSGVHKVLGWL